MSEETPHHTFETEDVLVRFSSGYLFIRDRDDGHTVILDRHEVRGVIEMLKRAGAIDAH